MSVSVQRSDCGLNPDAIHLSNPDRGLIRKLRLTGNCQYGPKTNRRPTIKVSRADIRRVSKSSGNTQLLTGLPGCRAVRDVGGPVPSRPRRRRASGRAGGKTSSRGRRRRRYLLHGKFAFSGETVFRFSSAELTVRTDAGRARVTGGKKKKKGEKSANLNSDILVSVAQCGRTRYK